MNQVLWITVASQRGAPGVSVDGFGNKSPPLKWTILNPLCTFNRKTVTLVLYSLDFSGSVYGGSCPGSGWLDKSKQPQQTKSHVSKTVKGVGSLCLSNMSSKVIVFLM